MWGKAHLNIFHVYDYFQLGDIEEILIIGDADGSM